ncbi:uncharacterized protein C11orf86 homolog [Vombatus ursinus]|uniref:uncharacterized protein C11orf86 homolog n=1 Tax=Vombatus ursinus TaxID=29139 RepID=UPI000FFDA119|nr:uncharacterized protein C11orf86 homolog [Vombatus ursinus]XP_027711835.1 uncharacterized protein C11orf86 homolog [Vombatus ursinus]
MVITRSQSLRVPRLSYGKLQEIWGEPSECKGLVPKGRQKAPRFQRALSFRHCREKPHSRCLETSSGLPAGLDPPPHEIPTEGLADTEQLVQGKNQGKPRIQQYKKQVDHALRRIWGNFVASLPGVTLSCSTCPRPPLDAAS